MPTIININSSCISPNSLLKNKELNPSDIQGYFLLSNVISALFSSESGIVPNIDSKNGPASMTNVHAIAPIGNSAPINQTQADMQAAGLLAFINRILASAKLTWDDLPDHGQRNVIREAESKVIQWAIEKLKALRNSVDPKFLEKIDPIINLKIDWNKKPDAFLDYWNSSWSVDSGTYKTIQNFIINLTSDQRKELNSPDNDTLFSLIMLSIDLSQEPDAKSNASILGEKFFAWEGSETAFVYARFVAWYLWNEAHNGKLSLDDSKWICETLLFKGPSGTDLPKTLPNTYAFIQSLEYMLDHLPDVTKDWPTTRTSPQFIIDKAISTWFSYLNYKN